MREEFKEGDRVTWSREGRMQLGASFTKRRPSGTVSGVPEESRLIYILWDGFSTPQPFYRDYIQAEASS